MNHFFHYYRIGSLMKNKSPFKMQYISWFDQLLLQNNYIQKARLTFLISYYAEGILCKSSHSNCDLPLPQLMIFHDVHLYSYSISANIQDKIMVICLKFFSILFCFSLVVIIMTSKIYHDDVIRLC